MTQPIPAPLLAGTVLGSSANNFVLAEWRAAGTPAGSDPQWIAPLHLHHNDDEAWYVLDGVLQIRRGEEVVEARAGSAVLVSRGTPHTYWNPSAEPTRYLLLMTPRIHALIQAIHAASDRSPAAMRALFAQYESELL